MVIVRDLQTREKFQFINDQWLAVEKGDGQVVIRNKVNKSNFHYDYFRLIESFLFLEQIAHSQKNSVKVKKTI